MDFKTAVRTCFDNYATFTGRARRPELWWFVVFVLIGNAVLGILDSSVFGPNVSVFGGIFSLVVLLPLLAVGARRLHDTGRSGWWLLLALIPVLGMLVLIWFYAQPGEDAPNAWGPPPVRA